jgi:hypothetical protein
VRGQEKEQAERSAIAQAKHFCEERNQYPAFIEESTQYTGSMDEATRDTLRKASTAAQVLGHTTGNRHGIHRTSGNQAPNAGDVIGSAGTVGAIMTSGWQRPSFFPIPSKSRPFPSPAVTDVPEP